MGFAGCSGGCGLCPLRPQLLRERVAAVPRGAHLTRVLLPRQWAPGPGERAPRAEMLLRDLVLGRGCCWPSLLLHCALHPLWGLVQVSRARAGTAGLGDSRAEGVR